MTLKKTLLTALTPLLLSTAAMAAPDTALLKQAVNGEHIDNIKKSLIDGLYQFNIGSDVYYLDNSGRYLLRGDVIDLKNKENLTEKNRAQVRAKLLGQLKKDDMIIFPAHGKTKHTVYVFTDIDCGYCRMLHSHIDEYNNKGIEIRYLSYPRAGIGSESYDKAVAVWCAKDKKKALTDAKKGLLVDSKSCKAPVRDQYNLGLSIGVNGTPAIVMQDGTFIPGFVKPTTLLTMLDRHDQEKIAAKTVASK